MDSRLTDGTIAEILMRHGELLQAYQNQIRELTEEYNTGNELIETLNCAAPDMVLLERAAIRQVLIKFMKP